MNLVLEEFLYLSKIATQALNFLGIWYGINYIFAFVPISVCKYENFIILWWIPPMIERDNKK